MKQIQLTIMALAAMFLISCGSSNTADDPSKQLETYRKQQSEIDAKINELQKQIADSDDGATSRNQVAVRIQELKATTFSHFFEVSGTVIAVQEAFISPEINGQIKEIFVKEGDRVKKGQVLAKLTTEVTDKSIEEVKTSLVLAEDVYQRQQRLWDQKIGSEMQYLQAKNNKISLENRLATLQAQIDLATVNAPIAGIVEKVNQKKGEMAAPGMQLIYMVNLDQILIRAEVSEKYIAAIKKGENVEVRFPSYPDFSKAFPVSRIGNVVNKNNRTFEMELKLDNPDGMFKPNMVAVLNINDFTAEGSLVVPSKVIKEDLKGKYLYVATKEGDHLIAYKKYVKPGRTYLDSTRITEGLTENDQIIVDGYNRVSDGTHVVLN